MAEAVRIVKAECLEPDLNGLENDPALWAFSGELPENQRMS